MRFLFAIWLLALLNGSSMADDPKAPQRLLFIGNSLTYTNDLPSLVQEMYVAGKQARPVVEAITAPGVSLGDQWQITTTRDRIISGRWNYIVLQQGPSSLASSQAEFLK